MSRARHAIERVQSERGTYYRARVDLGPDPLTGKRRQKRLTSPTRKQLERDIAEVIEQAATGLLIHADMLASDYFTQWLDTIKPTLRPLAHDRYRYSIEGRWTRALGHLKLAAITTVLLQRVIRDMQAEGLQNSTIAGEYAIVRNALKQAYVWNLIPRDPTIGVAVPRITHSSAAVWSREQANAFLAAIAEGDEVYHPFFALALHTGMRRGELLGLRWSEVDLEAGTIRILRTLVPMPAGQGGGMLESQPKTRRSHRTVPIAPHTVALLRAHRDRQQFWRQRSRDWQPLDLVLTNHDGLHLDPHLPGRRIDKYAKLAGVPRLRVHDLRHTAASLMLQAGEHPRVVSDRLGHASVAFTLDLYTHISQDQGRAAAERLERFMNGADS